jgi:hypothetical protein
MRFDHVRFMSQSALLATAHPAGASNPQSAIGNPQSAIR